MIGVRARTVRRTAGLILVAVALVLSGCHAAKPPASKTRGLSDWLAECSPFSPYDAGKALIFDYDGAADLDRGDNKAAWDRTQPEHVAGKWFGEEAGSSFDLTLPGKAPVHYVLQLPAAGHTCILAATASPLLDLRTVWFGSLKAPDGEDEDDP